MDELPNPPSQLRKVIPHYHGDFVRVFLFFAGLLMLIGLPFFKDQIDLPVYFSIIAITILVLLAGFTNPKQIWVAYLDFVISLVGFVVFEYYAAKNFNGDDKLFFLINQTIALLFVFALYFSTKTLRGFFLRNR